MSTWPRLRLSVVAAALLLGSAGCIVFVGPGDRDDRVRELVSARARWNADGRASYSYVLQRTCYCLPDVVRPVRVTVHQGVMVSAVYEATGLPVPAQYHSLFGPVEYLFDLIEEAIAMRAHRLDSVYDSGLGFPREVYVDYRDEIADDEIRYTAADLRPAP